MIVRNLGSWRRSSCDRACIVGAVSQLTLCSLARRGDVSSRVLCVGANGRNNRIGLDRQFPVKKKRVSADL